LLAVRIREFMMAVQIGGLVLEINASYVTGSKFTPEELAKHHAAK